MNFQNNLERQEFETRKALGKQVESLQLEMKTLRRKFDLEETDKKSSIGSLNVSKRFYSVFLPDGSFINEAIQNPATPIG